MTTYTRPEVLVVDEAGYLHRWRKVNPGLLARTDPRGRGGTEEREAVLAKVDPGPAEGSRRGVERGVVKSRILRSPSSSASNAANTTE